MLSHPLGRYVRPSLFAHPPRRHKCRLRWTSGLPALTQNVLLQNGDEPQGGGQAGDDALQFSGADALVLQAHLLHGNPPLRKPPQGLLGVKAFAAAKNLYCHHFLLSQSTIPWSRAACKNRVPQVAAPAGPLTGSVSR